MLHSLVFTTRPSTHSPPVALYYTAMLEALAIEENGTSVPERLEYVFLDCAYVVFVSFISISGYFSRAVPKESAPNSPC